MALVTEVYGQNYSGDAVMGRMVFAAKGLAQNIAHFQFNIRHDTDSIWNGNNMLPAAVGLIKTQAMSINPDMRLDHLNKMTETTMVPYLIDGAVEYFRVVDYKRKKIYLFYVTPTNMEQF